MAERRSSLVREHQLFPMPETNSVAIDRISNLPESLVTHILSFLPTTKEAAATSILSSKWRTFWTLLPDINLEDRSPRRADHHRRRTRFAEIVNTVFYQRRTQYIRKLRIVTRHKSCHPFHVFAWVSSAVAGNVQEMDLTVCLHENADLPTRLFTCKTIKVIKLSGNINLHVPSSVHLPSLKILNLLGLQCTVDDASVQRLLSGCPVVEDFSVDITKSGPSSFKISAPSLKKLWVNCESSIYQINKLEINTSSLEYLRIRAVSIQDYLLVNLQNVIEANVNVSVEDGPHDCIFKLLKVLHKVKSLAISLYTIESFIHAPKLDLPEFHNLVRLELTIAICDSNLLVNILQKCNKLEALVIEKVPYNGFEPSWEEPTNVPDCFSSHLTMVIFKGYRGTKNDVGLASYILKSASFLKTMKIYINCSLNLREMNNIMEQVSVLPRISDVCQLAFDSDVF